MAKKHAMWHQKRRGLDITFLMARDGCACALCGGHLDRHIKDDSDPLYITFDHKIPASRGGTDDLANLQLAHQECNWSRGDNDCIQEDHLCHSA